MNRRAADLRHIWQRTPIAFCGMHPLRRGALLLAAGMLAVLPLGQGTGADAAGQADPGSEHGLCLRILPNGLRVLIREHHAAPLVAIDLWIRAGSAEETTEEHGAAHFLEHLIFKGTPTRKPGEIDTAFEDLGATLAAGTTRDAAHFYSTVSSAYVADALPVLADAVMHPLLDAGEMERERGVILDELARSSNEARKDVLDRLFEALFPNSPYASPILGTPQAISRLMRPAVLGFYRRWYHPNNATLVLSGDITSGAAEELAARCFGAWERQTVPAPPAVATNPEARAGAYKAAAAHGLTGIGIACPPATDVKAAAALEIFARAAQARLASREHPRSAPSATVTFIPLREASLLAADAPLEQDRAPEILWKALTECVDTLTAEDIETARSELLGEYLYQTETEAGMAAMLGRFDAMGDYKLLTQYVDQMRSLSPNEVRAAARRILTPNQSPSAN